MQRSPRLPILKVFKQLQLFTVDTSLSVYCRD